MSKPSQFTIIGPNASEIARRTFKNVDMAAQLNEMADEIERLREALRRYACGCEIRHCGVSIHECGWVARAALGDGEND